MNQFARLHALGYRRLLPIIPPDADISPNSTLFKRVGTSQDGRGKTPGRSGRDGKWFSYDWTAYENDETDLTRWHAMGAGVGIKTGVVSVDGPFSHSLIAIDADTLNVEHAKTIRDQVESYFGRLPVRVGRYPKALYLLRTRGPAMKYMRVEFGTERVEFLSDGKQFVAEGVHPVTGKPYEWPRELVPFNDLLEVETGQVLAFMNTLQQLLPASTPLVVEGGGSEVSQASLTAPLEAVRRAVHATPNTSNVFPTRESYRDYGYAVKAALPENPDEALALFHEWCDQWVGPSGETNDPDVVDADWRRMKPPFRRGAPWLFDLAEQHGEFSRVEALWFDPAPPDYTVPPKTLFDIAVSEPLQTDTRPPLAAGRVALSDLSDLPPRQWMYGHKILRKYVTFIASPGGVGKTALTIAMALSCASNRTLLHDEPRSKKPLRVWLFNLEDDIVELRRRLAAALAHYGLGEETLEFIRLNSGRDRGVKIVKLGKDGDFVVQPDVEEIVRVIRTEGIDIAIFDPFLRTHGVPENENEAQDEVMRLFAYIAEQTNCGVVLVHHTKKGAIAGDLDSMRGGSTQGGGARAAFTLAPMSIEEAGRLGIAEAERRLYVRLDDAKNNMAPPIAKAEWLKLESHRLLNVTDDYPQGDSVQVAAKWTPPDAWEGLLAGETENVILAHLEAGPGDGERYSLRTQDGDRWAGTVLIDQFGRTPEQAKEVLASWQRQKLIEVRDYKSETQRKVRKGLFVVRPLADLYAKAPPPGGIFA